MFPACIASLTFTNEMNQEKTNIQTQKHNKQGRARARCSPAGSATLTDPQQPAGKAGRGEVKPLSSNTNTRIKQVKQKYSDQTQTI